MKLRYYPSVAHPDNGCIYSMDFHPNGRKLITVGQGKKGDGAGVIMVWDLKELFAGQKKVVLYHANDMKIMNCVRWSKADFGKRFACGGDSNEVLVYRCTGMTAGYGLIKNHQLCERTEKYIVESRLVGHTLDVLHVEWSHDGRFLASSSVDGTVIVWDATNLPTKVISLTKKNGGHLEPVKGISFDPVGKYFSTQSNDKTLKIWNTDDWSIAKTITEPFKESGHTSMFMRHDWTPDGSYLVAPGATNNGGPTAQIVKRKNWDASLDLVGHRKPVTCVRACPNLMQFLDHKGKMRTVSCFALGSADKGLSVWVIPSVSRPVIVLDNLFKHSIVDVAWNGFQLAACSVDGSVRFLEFKAKEIGELFTDGDMASEFQRMYKSVPKQHALSADLQQNGNAAPDSATKPATDNFGIIDPEHIKLRRMEQRRLEEVRRARAAESASVAPRKPIETRPISVSQQQAMVNKVRAAYGMTGESVAPIAPRKPVETPAPGAVLEQAAPQPSAPENGALEIAAPASRTPPPVEDEYDEQPSPDSTAYLESPDPAAPQAQYVPTTSIFARPPDSPAAPVVSEQPATPPKQSYVIDKKTKKKRLVNCEFMGSLLEDTSEVPEPVPTAPAPVQIRITPMHESTPNAVPVRPKKRRIADSDDEEVSPQPSRSRSKKNRIMEDEPEGIVSIRVAAIAQHSSHHKHNMQQPIASVPFPSDVPPLRPLPRMGRTEITLPPRKASLQINLPPVDEYDSAIQISVDETTQSNSAQEANSTAQEARSIIVATGEDKKTLWIGYIEGAVAVVEGNSAYMAVSTYDSGLTVFGSRSGEIFLETVTDAPAAILVVYRHFVIAVTVNASFYMYDVKKRKLILKTTVKQLMPETVTILSIDVHNDRPLLSLSNAKTFTWDFDLQGWSLLMSKNSFAHKASLNLGGGPSGILSTMLNKNPGDSIMVDVNVCSDVTENQVQRAVQAAISLNDSEEFERFATRLVQIYVSSRKTAKLSTFLEHLQYKDNVCGIPTSDLIATFVGMTGTISEFADIRINYAAKHSAFDALMR
ncbi:hypothetical protein L596_001812 [Steinernema carpocapsae]|uniref:Protein HIRA n=1 Tax=Steinernema carpocapsae TaxID=34508 RepID=A0A4V6YSU2_STECR|nr:hypothetical protein L596_001812 [Steinernema carpocapsae]